MLQPPPPPPPPPPPSAEEASSSDGVLPSSFTSSEERKRKRDTYYDREEDLEKLAAKDALTLMLRQLHPHTEEFDVFSLFSKAGKVNDVKLIIDDRSGKCQGVGYVEMADVPGLTAALQLNGQLLCGNPIVVGSSLAEKNRAAAAGASAADIKAIGSTGGTPTEGLKLYVGGLHYDLSEEQLRDLFAPFGPLDKVDLHREPTGESKGFGFVHYRNLADGRKCIEQMDGFQLAGRAIRVSVSAQDQSASSVLPGGGAPSLLLTGGGKAADNQTIMQLDSLDDASGGGKVSAAQRASIMAKLAHNAGLDVPQETLKAAQTAGLQGGENSRCVVLKNMFDRLSDEAQNNPNFFTEMAEDVRSEASKTGTVLHAAADKWSNGFVYLKMLAHTEAARIKELMHGRFFAKNKIIAEFVDEASYNKKHKLPSY